MTTAPDPSPPTTEAGWFDGFTAGTHEVGGTTLFARTGGDPGGPPLLLLHGSPQTHVMWHRAARSLRERYSLVLPDLRGYGDSPPVPDTPDHGSYSKRTMAQDAVDLMAALGHDRFAVVGHDRGGRVAHRLALDHPDRVTALCVIDIAPTLDMYEATDQAFATAYYHWFHLIQPAPLPETMVGGALVPYLHASLGGLGSGGLGYLEPAALAEYERCFTPATVHAICEDYRASAGIDLEHDRESRGRAERIRCPVHVLWGARGVVQRLFDPVALWQGQAEQEVSGEVLPAGHFIPEELPGQTAEAVTRFLDGAAVATR